MQKFGETLNKKPKQYIPPQSILKKKRSNSPKVRHETIQVQRP